MIKKSKWHTIPWNSEQYVKEMYEDKKVFIHIIALFAQLKKYTFENYEQMLFFIQRNQGVAKRLECFNLEKIKSVLIYLIENSDFKISLETVEKYIFEDVRDLKQEEPIIILSSGEKIYDVKRISQLETERKIYYSNNRWKEKNNN